MNWKVTPRKEYECLRRKGLDYGDAAESTLDYYGFERSEANIAEFLEQIDPFGHKEWLTRNAYSVKTVF